MDPYALITTIKDRCRVCYTCVRECPAKAIRIARGQAEVITARCIGCGHCVQVCSQGAKQVIDGLPALDALLSGPDLKVAMIAPSFPAEFSDASPTQIVGALRAMGFDKVMEVAFGADLVAVAYRDLIMAHPEGRYIATACPSVVSYVTHYHPDLIGALAPIVSPMIAMARAARRLDPRPQRVAFIGPCVAKKAEAVESGEIEAAITFKELRAALDARGIDLHAAPPSAFDPPRSGLGTIFPLSGGLLRAAALDQDLLSGDLVSAEGRGEFVEAIREFEEGSLDARLLDVLCCNGCLMGPGMTTRAPRFRRRALLSKYARQVCQDTAEALDQLKGCLDIPLTQRFIAQDQRILVDSEDNVIKVLGRMGKHGPSDELNCGACGYDTCREHALAILKGLAEPEMCLPFTIDQLHKTVDDLTRSNSALAETQEALMHSERLASMGQLAAGIAHEVNNPLGVVLMYAHLLLDEAEEETPLREDLVMIAEQADRCKKIVSGLLDFARQKKVERRWTGICDLFEATVLSLEVNPKIRAFIDCPAGLEAELDRDQILQVLVNLARNAVDAMPQGGGLYLRARGEDDELIFEIEDTGSGIDPQTRKKIFEPFFTTKPVGKGTGLGLSVSYGIVKMHHGQISVRSNADPAQGPTGTTFKIDLPTPYRLVVSTDP
ncbi:4Fe-4S dicluster domain-containing protein [Myxococcota bacterium]|nr:4Fe-4S dicluster domain-containing protein [Myxococcota bacterium]MBU1429303.1 4Fe-4S dicluster domain-containing protein [Myxococcota bacterium]MBU1899311.1 4Fe-4S dicluster domain-containing protein [Myxococcota bacterium]